MKRPLSLSGVEIDGDSLVRMVYLDESGISIKERFTVVAGVIINADQQWKVVEKYVQELIEEYGGSYLPISKIVDTVHFASKNEAILLQIADVCAFIVRCFLEKKPHAEDFLNAFTDNTPSLLAPARTGKDDDPAGYKILGFRLRSTNSASLA